MKNGEQVTRIIKTTVGRVLFNEVVPAEAGYINEVLTKKSLRDIIGNILKVTSIPVIGKFLDEKSKTWDINLHSKEVFHLV